MTPRDGQRLRRARQSCFDFKAPRPNLLVELATERSFVFRAAQDTVFGTGPFRIADWQPQKHLA